ncbi:hypothetical protein M0R88_11420 [Halorussus gelatinilyticus]|uniref:PGF-CTERM sorting domain-containing protein n=1 Tax=Halorussus gelatinilyticus TaxID=2937524 RepID=A0A8U0IEL2_9EURY|nr:BGTF surface domain-containing protein [Halorussus gelatinilyticus]UPV99135.1 hypothetical protein M0R88_11420 [Halorussus gelatinilyticus]
MVAAVPPAAVSATPATQVAFTDNVVSEQRGDVAEIGVAFEDGDTATVRIGSEASHVATVTVRDRDGDGRALLRLNTYDGSVAASDGDATTVRSRSNVTTPLATGTYDLALWSGNDTDGDQRSVATLSLSERSTDNLFARAAPSSADLSNLSEVNAALRSDNLTRSGVLVRNGTLVLELLASGLTGAVAAQDGRNVTERFVRFLEQENASLTVYDVPGTEQERAYLDLTNESAVTVVRDARNDSYYVVAELDEVAMTDGDDGDPANNHRGWGDHRANFSLAADSSLTTDGRETATAEFEVDEAEATLSTPPETDKVYLAPAPNQTVWGTTTLAPGSRVAVRIRDGDGLRRSETVRVENRTDAPGGSFAANFDLGEVAPETELGVTVRAAGESSLTHGEETDGVVLESNAALNLTGREPTDQGVGVSYATLSHGGYVAVHRGSADGPVVGRSSRLAPGEAFSHAIELGSKSGGDATLVAVAHRAEPGDELGRPYTENGNVVAEAVERTGATTTDDETATVRTTATATTRTTETTVESTPTAGPSAETGIPGFGVGAATVGALVALLAGLALARRE